MVRIAPDPFLYHLLIVGAERIGFMQSRINTTTIRYEKGCDPVSCKQLTGYGFASLRTSYIHIRRPASDFFQDRENIGKLFMWLQIFYFKQRRGNLTGLLFCLDFICQGLLITKIVICIHYLIVSSPHAARPTTLSFA